MAARPLELGRDQIVAFRRRVGALDERLPPGADSLRRAAWAGLADSMPRAALHSIHARVAGTGPATWEDETLVQLWGPRFADYVVAAQDLAPFSLGRLPENSSGRTRAFDTAARLHTFLDGRRMPFGDAGHAMDVPPNSLRYAAATGTVVLRWDGAHQPVVWTVPPPTMTAIDARLELARRFLHIFGPTTPRAFVRWGGLGAPAALGAFEALASRGELMAVRTPLGEAWILADDEASFGEPPSEPAAARLLPSGDAYYLLWGHDRSLLVPEADRRAALWTSRVWPGALLVGGEITGTWRRSGGTISIDPWRPLTTVEREAIEAEARSLPLPGLARPATVRWAP